MKIVLLEKVDFWRGGQDVIKPRHFVFITSVPLCENNLLFPSAILFVSSGKDEALFNYERNKTVLAANFVTALLLTSPGMPVHAEELKVEEAVTNGGFYTVVSWKKENDLLICSFSGIGKKKNLNKFLTKLLKGGQSVIICQTRQAFSTGSGYCRGCYSQWYRKTH